MFNNINANLLLSKENDIENTQSQTHIYSALLNKFNVGEINFEKIDPDNLIDLMNQIFSIVQSEDDDGYITLDKNHPYSKLSTIQDVMHCFERTPRQRVPSAYRFV